MKNYYDQQMELNVVLFRIETLNEKKAIYFNQTQPKSGKIKEVMVDSSRVIKDTFLEYTEKVEDINKELDDLYKEKEILERYLKKMEESLRSMKGIKEKIFVAKFIDGLSAKQISRKMAYSKTSIYRILSEIYQIIQVGKKWEKNNDKM